MTLPVKEQAKYWGLTAALFLVILWYLGDVILPFVLGGAVAYILDPVADRLQRLGLSRILSVVVITLVATLLFVLAILLIIPTLVQQAGQLVNTFPQMFQRVQNWLTTRFPDILEEGSMIRQQLGTIGETLQARGGDLINGLLSSAVGVINVLLLIVVVPVVTFYLLLDWDRMIARIDELMPREHVATVRGIARDIDATLASFIRGQGLVCVILGTYYAVGLMLVGLNFGLVVGFIGGLITFIPYVGALVGGVLAVGLALFQFWGEWLWIGVVAGIFVLGQFLEGNVLTPKLVGNSVGLHPVWLLFALSVFGSLFGFVGMLIAVPVAAVLGVLTRFGLTRYRQSRLYQGNGDAPDPADED